MNRLFESRHRDRRRELLRLVATLAAAAAFPVRAQGVTDPAVTRIRTFYDALLAAMKQATQLGIKGRYDKLAPVIRATFDLPAMTRIAVGPEWNSIAPDQQKALIDAFSDMTIATYANQFDGYSGEQFIVEPQVEQRTTGRVVHTTLKPGTGDPVTLNYLMRGSGSDWKIIDVYLTGTISQLATRRSEFGTVLKSGGPDALIASLKQQAAKMMRGQPGAK